MRLAERIARLESSCPRVGPCEGCGIRDLETGLIKLFWPVLISRGAATYACMCKYCGREFLARLAEHETLLLAEDLGPTEVM